MSRSLTRYHDKYRQAYLITVANRFQICLEELLVRKVSIAVSKGNIVRIELSIHLMHQPVVSITTQVFCDLVPIHSQISCRRLSVDGEKYLSAGDKLARNSQKTLNPILGQAGQ